MPIFSIPKTDREFWGAEYLNPNGLLSLSSALLRIETYVRVHNLLREDGQSFKMDDVLKSVLATDKPCATYDQIPDLLAPRAVSV